MKLGKLYHGDCLEIMKQLPDNSIDMILCDLPYGTTACPWDIIIPFEELWSQYNRIIKYNGNIVLFGAQPFTSFLILSNLKDFKYSIVWKKSKSVSFVHAKNMPLKYHEDICVFSKGVIGHKNKNLNRMTYNPQNLIKIDKKWSRKKEYASEHNYSRKSHLSELIIEYTNYPKSVIEVSNSNNKERGAHPTQKPVSLFEYLIKTYSNEGEVVLDNCIGAGTTAIAAMNTNRKWIGIEKEEKYYEIAKKRIMEHKI